MNHGNITAIDAEHNRGWSVTEKKKDRRPRAVDMVRHVFSEKRMAVTDFLSRLFGVVDVDFISVKRLVKVFL